MQKIREKLENLEQFIAPLLKHHDCVMIPDFGGFVLNKHPAGFLGASHEIFPQTKTVSFNKNLSVNDGLLAQHIAQVNNIIYADALLMINSEVERMRIILDEGSLIKFPGIGYLSESAEKTIIFNPDYFQNYLLASYGLPYLLLSPIEKQMPAKIYQLPERKIVFNREQRINGPMVISIAASLILAFIVFFKNASIDPNQIAQTINFQKKIAHNSIGTAALASPGVILPRITANIFEGETKDIDHNANFRYYIVAGAFKKEANATAFVRKLRVKGYDAQVLNTENGFYRVTYIMEHDSIKADADLQKIKISENQGAWLLKW